MIKCFGSLHDVEFPRFIWPWNTLFSGTVPGKYCSRTDLKSGEKTVQGDTLEPLEGCWSKVVR